MKLCRKQLHDVDLPDGRNSDGGCRACKIISSSRNGKTEKARESQRRWRKANPERILELGRRWKKANPERVLERARRWRKGNPEKMNLWSKRWQKANPERKGFSQGLVYLRKALENPVLKDGWPDAGAIEQKIAGDFLSERQWVRFAWLKKYLNTDVAILWSASHEDAVLCKSKYYYNMENYIAHFQNEEASRLWPQLLEKVPKT